VLIKGNFECQVLRTIEHAKVTTFASDVDREVANAWQHQSEEELLLERRTGQLVWLGAILAGTSAAIKGLNGYEVSQIIASVFAFSMLLSLTSLLRFVRAFTITGLFKEGVLIRNPHSVVRFEKARTAVFDLPYPIGEYEWEFAGLDILDERFDSDSLRSVLISLLRHSEDDFHRIIYQALRPQTERLVLYSISGLHYEDPYCAIGELEGARLTFGTEEFLIRRSVYLQPSEVLNRVSGDTLFFFGVGKEVVARVRLSRKPHMRGIELASTFKRSLGLRFLWWGSAPSAELDKLGKSLGLEASQVQGDLSVDEFRARLGGLQDAVLVTYQGSAHEEQRSLGTVARFDPARGRLPATQVVLLHKSNQLLSSLFKLIRHAGFVEKSIVFMTMLATALLFLGVVFSILGIGHVSLLIPAVSVLIGLVVFRYSSRCRMW
jgi:hypothetical protein